MQPDRMKAVPSSDDVAAAGTQVPVDHAAQVDALVAAFATVVGLAPPGRLQRVELAVGDASLAVDLAEVPGTGAVAAPVSVATAVEVIASPPVDVVTDTRVDVTAPIVGVFDAAPRPGAEPFCRPGDTVQAGAQLGIVEAMKMMNEIVAPCSGTLVSVEVDSGAVVEFGQPLFVLDPGA